MSEVVYENHLKHAYSVKSNGKQLVITDTSFFQLSEEAAWLIGELPDTGSETSYLQHLSDLGLNEPHEIFNRLVSINALRIKRSQNLANIFKRIINPKVQILTSQIQEKFLTYLRIDLQNGISRQILILAGIVSLAGLFWGSFLALAGTAKAIPASLTGHPHWIQVFLFAITGSLLHELGHSWMAAATGIGIRPIGLSIYLVFPVFYTNVSGIEKVSLTRKALIDCGGFIFQGIFIFLLLMFASLTGSYLFVEASRWMMVLIFFNLNPFLRTDGYWIYKDFNSGFKDSGWTKGVQIFYLIGYVIFSIYFLSRVASNLANISIKLTDLISAPQKIFSHGYVVVGWVYLLLMGFAGSFKRFQEIRHEWDETIK